MKIQFLNASSYLKGFMNDMDWVIATDKPLISTSAIKSQKKTDTPLKKG